MRNPGKVIYKSRKLAGLSEAAYGGLQALCKRQAAGAASLEELHSEETVVPGKNRAGEPPTVRMRLVFDGRTRES